MRVVLACLALAVASVSAFNPARCSNVENQAEFTYDLLARCYNYESDGSEATTTVNIVLTPEQTQNEDTFLIYIWNIENEASWAMSQFTPSTGAFTPVAHTTSSNFAAWMRYTPMASIQSETVSFTFDGSAGTETDPVHFGVTVVVEPAVPSTRTVSTLESVSFEVLPGTVVTNPMWNIDAPYTSERYIVQETVPSATARFTGGLDASSQFTSTITSSTIDNNYDATTMRARSTFALVSRPDGNTQSFELSSDTFTTAAHDFATYGPAIEASFMFTVREYPEAAAGGDTIVSGTPTIVMMDVPSLWTTTESTIVSADPTATVVIEYAMNPTAEADISSTTPLTAAAAPTIANPMSSYSDRSLVAPTTPRFPPRVFARVTATSPTDTVVMNSVLAVAGECASYVDCRKDEDEHPSPRGGLSANGDVTRFRHCALVPDAVDPTVPVGRCVECLADCDCGAGQFCYSDPGVCRYSSTGSFYTCDDFSRQRLGVCIDKDPTGQIIGAGCRSTGAIDSTASAPGAIASVQTYQTGVESGAIFANVGSPEALPLNDEGARVDRVPDGGAGFCGRARFFNSSNVDLNGDASADAAASRSGGARAVLWQGYCSNGICMECLGDSFSCAGAQQCIDGKTAQTLVVDGTARTFQSNTVAGTMLGAVLMIILLQLCVCCRICQARRYRKQDQQKAREDAGEEEPKVMF